MKEYFSILQRCPLFEGVSDEHLLTMLGCLGAKVERFEKKYTVMAEGSTAKYIGIVLSGAVQVFRVDYYGNRSILSESRPGETFGEAFACAEFSALPVTVIASDDAEVMLINCHHLLHTCANNCGFHQQLIFNLMKNLASKNIGLHQKLEIVSHRSTREKLLAYLMLQAKKEKSNRFEIPFDRQELADYLEVDRSGLSVQIGKLREEGILKSRKNHFELL